MTPSEIDVELFGEELAALNAMPAEQRRAYVAQRQAAFNPPHDLVQKAGFPTEYWDSLEEIPPDLLKLERSGTRQDTPR